MGTNYKPETICIQAGYRPGKGEPRVLPIYQSTTFKYENSDQMGRLFDLEETGYFYTRLQNPTNDAVAAKITELEGGIAGMLVSPLYAVTIELGSSLALKTFISAVVGGLGNFVGAVVGGILVGLTETLAATYIASAYKDMIVYVAGIVVLAFFPYGIFRRVKTKH